LGVIRLRFAVKLEAFDRSTASITIPNA
jgi:hypothetical protein